MKAIVYAEYGPPEVLRLTEAEKPSPADDEVLISVRAAEVTKADCEMRAFKFAVRWLWLPMRIVMGIRRPKRNILGCYFAGEIETVGKDVERLQAGEQVFVAAGLTMGGYAEYACVPSTATIVAKPSNMSFEEAAVVPLGGLNALHFMRRANIRRGETVLVIGAGGSIGLFSVQIAKAFGAEVTAVDATHKLDLLRSIGADHAIDYTRQDFTQNGESYDVIMDMRGNKSYSGTIESLKSGGRYLIANPRLSDMIRAVWTSKTTDKQVIFAFAREKPEELNDLKDMIEAGAIRSVVDRSYPLTQAAEAQRRVETEQRVGCIALITSDADR